MIKNQKFPHKLFGQPPIIGERPSLESLNLFGSTLQLMELSYGEKFMKSLNVLIVTENQPTESLKRKSKRYVQNILADFFPDEIFWLQVYTTL